MIKIPNKVKVGYLEYEVEVKDKVFEYKDYLVDEVQERNGNPTSFNHGVCDTLQSKIILAKNDDKQKEVNTFLHECLHMIFYAYGCDEDKDTEEKVINITANGLIELFQRNPEVLNYLYKNIKEVR